VKRFLPSLLVLLAALAGAGRVALRRTVPGDFLRYHRAGRLVVTGRAELIYDADFLLEQSVYAEERESGGDRLRESEFKYAPAFAVAMAPLGALPPRPASIVWGALGAGLLATMLIVAWRWCGAGLSPWWMAVPVACLVRPLTDNVSLGQINPWAIGTATIGLALVARGREAAGGALVGFGAVVKYMPGLLVVWLVWRRRWAALASGAAVVVLLGLALPAVVLGPARSIGLAQQWIDHRAHVYTDAASDDVPGYSLKSFVYRALGDTPYMTNESETPVRREAPHASLPPETLRAIVVAADLAILAAALWLTRRRADADRPEAAAVWLAALLVVSPESRFPHFLYLALPLVALTAALVRGRGSLPRWRTSVVLCVLGAVLLNSSYENLTGAALGRAAEFYCGPGWSVLAFGAALVLTTGSRGAVSPTP
jgi:hypothetical protein